MEVIVEPINCDMYMANIFQLNTKIIAIDLGGYFCAIFQIKR